MRKCPYCGMVSQGGDLCTWCKRPFDNGVYARAGIKPPKKGPSPLLLPVKISGLVGMILLAIFVLAHQKWVPDAARVVQVATPPMPNRTSEMSAVVPQGVSHGIGSNPVAAQAPPASFFVAPAAPQAATTAGGTTSGSTQVSVQGLAKLAEVHISTANDGTDHETALGSVLIVNLSPYEISDFRLGLQVNGSVTALVPFEGSINYPTDFTNKRIPPHGRLQVAVMTPTHYTSTRESAKSVILEATFEGAGGIASDTAGLR